MEIRQTDLWRTEFRANGPKGERTCFPCQLTDILLVTHFQLDNTVLPTKT